MAKKYKLDQSGIYWIATCKGSDLPVVSGTDKGAVIARAKQLCKSVNIVRKFVSIEMEIKKIDQIPGLVEIKKWERP